MGIKKLLNLSISLAKADFKTRNEGSYLGILWYLLNPILIFTLLLFLFSKRLGQDIPFYPLYLLLGVIMFSLFQQITSSSITTMRANRLIIKSLKFPLESLIASNVLRYLFVHIFEVIIFIAVMLILKVPINPLVFYIPLLIFFCFFLYGFSLILSTLYIYFRDLENIWVFVTKLMFFATPIFYSIDSGSKIFIVNLLNPMFYFITIARDIIIYNKMPEFWMISITIIFSLLFLIIGSIIFKKTKSKFAELM
ncbi:ABC transporter permease [Nanoarchaeota archaeon]